MATRKADLDRAPSKRMLALFRHSTTQLKVTRGVTRPGWAPEAGHPALLKKARGVATSDGRRASPWPGSGGGSAAI